MAPGARIHYEGPDGLNNAIAADAKLVDRNRVEVISNSWGGPELATSRSYFRAAEDVFMQAAAQGITMLYSSGRPRRRHRRSSGSGPCSTRARAVGDRGRGHDPERRPDRHARLGAGLG